MGPAEEPTDRFQVPALADSLMTSRWRFYVVVPDRGRRLANSTKGQPQGDRNICGDTLEPSCPKIRSDDIKRR